MARLQARERRWPARFPRPLVFVCVFFRARCPAWGQNWPGTRIITSIRRPASPRCFHASTPPCIYNVGAASRVPHEPLPFLPCSGISMCTSPCDSGFCLRMMAALIAALV
jgi:hypothetical protein